jgi:DNA-binding GntR family transcriptional regulator
MPPFQFEEQKTTSLRHKVTEDIRKAILLGQLKPGDRLREVEVSKQMGVSRGPIREALRMLEQEGLLISQPYKETTVAEISSEEVQEVLLPIRLTLEKYAIRKALPNIGEAQLAKLRAIVAAMQEGARQLDLAKVVESDLSFHEYLIDLAGIPSLLSTWSSINNRIRLHFIVQGRTYDNLEVLYHSHQRLLDTIETRELDNILAEITIHIQDWNNTESK